MASRAGRGLASCYTEIDSFMLCDSWQCVPVFRVVFSCASTNDGLQAGIVLRHNKARTYERIEQDEGKAKRLQETASRGRQYVA